MNRQTGPQIFDFNTFLCDLGKNKVRIETSALVYPHTSIFIKIGALQCDILQFLRFYPTRAIPLNTDRSVTLINFPISDRNEIEVWI